MKQHDENIKETVVERYLVKQVKDLGGRAMKFVSPAHRGRTDQIIARNNVIVFCEVKTVKGELSPLQIKEHQDLLKHYDKVTAVYGKGGVDRFLVDLAAGNSVQKEYRP